MPGRRPRIDFSRHGDAAEDGWSVAQSATDLAVLEIAAATRRESQRGRRGRRESPRLPSIPRAGR
jgi:hypothetical protein